MTLQPLPPETAEDIALRALAWIASDTERASAFMGASGLTMDRLRDSAGDPAFLGAVLDFVLMDDASVLALADELSRPPEDVLRARGGLPGGDLPHWT